MLDFLITDRNPKLIEGKADAGNKDLEENETGAPMRRKMEQTPPNWLRDWKPTKLRSRYEASIWLVKVDSAIQAVTGYNKLYPLVKTLRSSQ